MSAERKTVEEPKAGSSARVAEAPPAVEPLWDVKACARYLRRSPRWVWACLTRRPEEPGSIPHIRLPGNAPRFIPERIREWVESGCPPAADFSEWRVAERKRRGRRI